jgi:hypothetical protein
MKTAIEYLIEQLGEYFPDYIGGIELLVKEVKQMEKEALISENLNKQLKFRAFPSPYNVI